MPEAVLVEVQVTENDVSQHVSCGGQAVQERVSSILFQDTKADDSLRIHPYKQGSMRQIQCHV
jgi:hypothetical protein